ncbi:DNA/RNA non-specific endonuclease [uncultured Microbacterium sp.]|uniref:DNA/RNA non-specific endonuclease n=1 Tax=uncultured Microbacterium sp. TaxID=191216 RepID=UPI0025D113CC|nr:DNA/RNA non-specific endonuclease [uncultured Microbacterium sp.]
MSDNALVAAPVDAGPTAFGGAYLLQDGADLAHAFQTGNWVEGGVAAFSTVLDGIGAVIDPIGTLIANGLGWVIDHIEPLRGWLQDLTGNAAEVQAFAQTWTNVSGRLQQVGGDLQHRLSDLEGMSGATVDAYRAHVQELADSVASTGSWAGAVSGGLDIAAMLVQAVYELVRDAISQVVGVAISAAITTAATVGFGAPLAIGQIVTKVSSLAARVGSFVTKLLRSLNEAIPLLRRLSGVVEEVATRLRGRVPGHGATPDVPTPHGSAPDAPAVRAPEADAPAASLPRDEPAPAGGGRLGGGSTTPEGHRPLTQADIDELPVVRDGTHMGPDGRPLPDTWYQTGEHDYVYHTDSNGHIDRFHAEELQIKTHEGRLSHDPGTPGKLEGDHAGHLAGDLFGGSPKLDNLVSQLSSINLSDYRKLEIQWADALRAEPPGSVSVDVRLVTDATGRPTRFIVESIVNGELVKATFRQ